MSRKHANTSQASPNRVRSRSGARLTDWLWGLPATDLTAVALMILMWSFVVLPMMFSAFTVPQGLAEVGAQQSGSTPIYRLTFLALFGFGAVVIVLRITHMFDAGFYRFVVILAPWAFMVVRDLYNGDAGSQAFLYPVLVVAIAVLRPHPRVLVVLAWLVGLTACICIMLGVLWPSVGLMQTVDSSGAVLDRTDDKALFPSLGLLKGMFSSENNMAQFLVLGLPFILLIRTFWGKALVSTLVGFAVLWSSSRNALAGFVLILVAAILLHFVRDIEVRAWAARMGVLASGLLLALLPFLNWPDDAFTDRGGIWRESLNHWLDGRFWFGAGSDWYLSVGQFSTSPVIQAAFHAHNQTVQLFVTGGVVYALLFAVMLVTIARELLSVQSPFILLSSLAMVSLFVTGLFEVPFGVVDRVAFWPVTLLPLSILFFRDTRFDPPDVRARQYALRRGRVMF